MNAPTEGQVRQGFGSSETLNGTEDDALNWHRIDWGSVERDVKRLRQRIFKAAQQGDGKRVRNLQKLMLRSRSNVLHSVRRVTQLSTGRRTSGVDGETAQKPRERGALVRTVCQQRTTSSIPRPVKRVYIPKANGKVRPLGIPVIRDRVHQACVKNALEPEWEARFETRNYGFRPGRGCHDAIGAIHTVLARRSGTKRPWILDADLSGAFDRISHRHLMESIGWFPAREEVLGWLTAGVMDRGRFAPTQEGTPQGGVISPLLLNIALHGMETAAGAKTSLSADKQSVQAVRKTPILIRYADDFVVLCHSKEEAERCKEMLAGWLTPRGLSINEDKTRIVYLDEGFDFLGFNVRRYAKNGKVLVKPSKEAVERARRRVKEVIRSNRGHPGKRIIMDLNPFVKGWTSYYRPVSASKAFQALDDYAHRKVWAWAKRSHRRHGGRWIAKRYWGQHNPARADRWVFGDDGTYLWKFSWTKIQRHPTVRGTASKDDPAMAEYWEKRQRRRGVPDIERKLIVRLAVRQKGLCPGCGLDLVEGAGFELEDLRSWVDWFTAATRAFHVHHKVLRKNGGSDDPSNLELRHALCHQQLHAADHTIR
ncbi:group II intron reverse transcriptase/maturase [Streptomyces sp. NBC_00872]|uniref:group II intron reverse transcriptase/maturase n=1 Tax=Streptomyces sp. NBC_00872 TaxID=2903686 RepID=UPI00386E02F9|nr:group II intron reverse transcriptase/maturase [Streptomyces sp. NBC_00872]